MIELKCIGLDTFFSWEFLNLKNKKHDLSVRKFSLFLFLFQTFVPFIAHANTPVRFSKDLLLGHHLDGYSYIIFSLTND